MNPIESLMSHDKLNRHLYAALMIGGFMLAWNMAFQFESPDPQVDTIAVTRAGALALGLIISPMALAVFDALVSWPAILKLIETLYLKTESPRVAERRHIRVTERWVNSTKALIKEEQARKDPDLLQIKLLSEIAALEDMSLSSYKSRLEKLTAERITKKEITN